PTPLRATSRPARSPRCADPHKVRRLALVASGRLWLDLPGLGLGLGLGSRLGSRLVLASGWAVGSPLGTSRTVGRRLGFRLAWCGFAALCLLGRLAVSRAHVALHSSQS